MVQPMNLGPCAFWTGERSVSPPVERRRGCGAARDLPARRPASGLKRRSCASQRRAWRERVTTLLALTVLLGAMGVIGGRAWRGAARILSPTMPLTVPVTVRSGDSLWSLARRYGDPSAAIRDRVDRLARANRLPASAVLVPGQKVAVPVLNPVEVARLRRAVAQGNGRRPQ